MALVATYSPWDLSDEWSVELDRLTIAPPLRTRLAAYYEGGAPAAMHALEQPVQRRALASPATKRPWPVRHGLIVVLLHRLHQRLSPSVAVSIARLALAGASNPEVSSQLLSAAERSNRAGYGAAVSGAAGCEA
jgi:hypothetical protein